MRAIGYREDLFPAVTFPRAFDALQATHGEARVTDTLRVVLDAGRFDYEAVQQRVAPATPTIPTLIWRPETCACTTRC